MLNALDFAIIVIYLVAVAALGIRLAGRQLSKEDYFLGGRDLPWWAVCFSVVATETSTLTVIGLPAIAYGGSLTFMQLTIGYLIGRTLVSFYLLPRYFEHGVQTTYGYLGRRFGDRMRALAAATFLITRLLADGVRLFATAIPIKVIADGAGFSLGYPEIVVLLVVVTLAYTYVGGIKAVVWIDVVQLVLYLVAGVVLMGVLLSHVDAAWWARAGAAEKTVLLDLEVVGSGFANLATRPYFFLTAIIGGAVFSMASHGVDQLLVQRLLACRSLRDGQKALIGSALLAMLQFALFLIIGLLLWTYYDGASPAVIGLSRTDEVLPKFIVEGLPPGLSGLLLAGIIAAAMSTLSSSVNSLASSSTLDLIERFRRPANDSLALPRMLTLAWGAGLCVFASLLSTSSGTVIELGLTVASFTYGALLGAFLLALLIRGSDETGAIAAFSCTVGILIVAVAGVWYAPGDGWSIDFRLSADVAAEQGFTRIAWPWFPLIGVITTLVMGGLVTAVQTGMRKRGAEAPR